MATITEEAPPVNRKKTRQIIVTDSWHSIQLYQPQAVIDSVLNLLREHYRNQTDKQASI
ncbi:hypothetical protein ACFTAO_08875 [Paenibacillus rhizoplanae]